MGERDRIRKNSLRLIVLDKTSDKTPAEADIEKERGKFVHYQYFKKRPKIFNRKPEFNIRKEIFLPILGLAAGEILMFLGHVYAGLAVHVINLQAVTLVIVFGKFPSDTKNVLQSLLLLLQMRIINLAMPQFFTLTLLWYPLIYGVMFIPVYYVTKKQKITSQDIGVDLKRWYIYLPAALLVGTAMALLEFRILHPVSMITNLQINNLLLIVMVMFVFVAAVEELIFRSILQTRLEKVFGSYKAVLLSAALFGIMHAGYGLVSEVLFAAFFGAVLGFIYLKTRSFPFILVIHGTANVLLFGVLPIVSG
jgi:membrane protease YdiL (CAAX protease family)